MIAQHEPDTLSVGKRGGVAGWGASAMPSRLSRYWSTRYAKHPKLIAALDKPIPDDLAGVVATNLRLLTFTRIQE